jgi:hypothetical protein
MRGDRSGCSTSEPVRPIFHGRLSTGREAEGIQIGFVVVDLNHLAALEAARPGARTTRRSSVDSGRMRLAFVRR